MAVTIKDLFGYSGSKSQPMVEKVWVTLSVVAKQKT